MDLSKNTIDVLVDLIENKLSMMQIGDREELREIATLERSLGELRRLAHASAADEPKAERRGRRKKLSSLVADYEGELLERARQMA